MKRRIIRSSASPVKAAYDVPNLGKFAQNIAYDMEELLDRTTRVPDISGVLTQDEIGIISEAYDILLEFSRAYQLGNYTEAQK